MGNALALENLLEIERGFWFKGADYYREHITDDATFVFPGMVLDKEDGITGADSQPRWDKLDSSNEKLIQLSDETAILTYHAEGQREGSEPYSGNITTIYRLEDGDPKMAFHQHTPDPEE